MKQYFSGRNWIDETILCKLEAEVVKEILAV